MIKGTEIPFARPMDVREAEGKRFFESHPNRRYSFVLPDLAVTFEADYLHRERHELHGELTVRCGFAGARTVDGVLSLANFNFSSETARKSRGVYCSDRSKAKDIDWVGLIEEFCFHIAKAERYVSPDISLADVPMPEVDSRTWFIDKTFPIPSEHPMIWFGDGGSCKSFLALYAAIQLAFQGIRILYCDWELSERDHRERLDMLSSGAALPDIRYIRCERPLIDEADRIRKIVTNRPVDYVICDSIAFATAGRPEEAENANEYFRAVRSWNVGSLHLAHRTKAEDGDKNPFGSIFYANNARSIWYLERDADEEVREDTYADGPSEFVVGFFQRKNTRGRRQRARAYRLAFQSQRLTVTPTELATSSPELAQKLSLRERMHAALRRGARTVDDLASELDAKPDSLMKALRRDTRTFVRTTDGRVGLAQRC